MKNRGPAYVLRGAPHGPVGANANIVWHCGFSYHPKEEHGIKVMRRNIGVIATVTSALVVGGCAVVPPSGPTVMALPGQGKTLAAFQQDDYTCRGYAQQQTGIIPAQAAGNAAVGSAIVGTALGAAAGAAIGAAAGNPGAGAAIGAATGLVGGTAVGANNAAATQAGVQQRYDIAYTQCMYAHGNSVQSPPPAYAGYGYPAYGGYPYAYPAYGYGYYGPSFAIGFGGGGGWGGWGGWHGGWGGWHGGGWHH